MRRFSSAWRDGGPRERDALARGHHAAVSDVHLQADVVEDVSGVGEGGLHFGVGGAELAAALAAVEDRRDEMQARALLPAGDDILAVDAGGGGANEDFGQEVGLGDASAGLSGGDRLLGDTHLGAKRRGLGQQVAERARERRLELEVEDIRAASSRCGPSRC